MRREFAWALEHPWRVVWALTALALVLRFATLDARGFWLDEAITVDLIRGSLGDVTSRLDAYTLDQPPLYYLIAWGWAQLFGTGEVGLRSLPAICGALAVPVAYLAATELFSKRAGLVAALLTALSPLVVWHSQDARPYALLILLGGASFALFVRVLHDRRPWVVAGWAVVSVLAMATHYAVGFLVAAEVIWLLFSIRGEGAQSRRCLPGSRRWARASCSCRRAGAAEAPSATASGLRAIRRGEASSGAGSAAGGLPAAAAARLGGGGCAAGRRQHSPCWSREEARREHSAAAIAAFVCVIGRRRPDAAGGDGRPERPDHALPRRRMGAHWSRSRRPDSRRAEAERWARRSQPPSAPLFLAVVLGSAWEPKFDRDDWRGAAQALGPAAVARAVVVSPDLGTPALELYLPGSRALRERGEAVREVALVGLPKPFREPGEQPRPRPVSIRAHRSGFVKVRERLGAVYTVVLFRARGLALVQPAQLRRRALGESDADVLFEQAAGGRCRLVVPGRWGAGMDRGGAEAPAGPSRVSWRLSTTFASRIRYLADRETRRRNDRFASPVTTTALRFRRPALVYSVAGHFDLEEYYESGRAHAELLKEVLSKNDFRVERFRSILDFGCGCGRVIRHWRGLPITDLRGSDYNPRLVEWCRDSLPFAEFRVNELVPPLPYGPQELDFVYAISVFTHLTEELQHSWMRELERVLAARGRPSHQRRRGARGSAPSRRRSARPSSAVSSSCRPVDYAGRNLCAAFHPESYVRERLAGSPASSTSCRPRGAADAGPLPAAAGRRARDRDRRAHP